MHAYKHAVSCKSTPLNTFSSSFWFSPRIWARLRGISLSIQKSTLLLINVYLNHHDPHPLISHRGVDRDEMTEALVAPESFCFWNCLRGNGYRSVLHQSLQVGSKGGFHTLNARCNLFFFIKNAMLA